MKGIRIVLENVEILILIVAHSGCREHTFARCARVKKRSKGVQTQHKDTTEPPVQKSGEPVTQNT